jgi:hypothetical protein
MSSQRVSKGRPSRASADGARPTLAASGCQMDARWHVVLPDMQGRRHSEAQRPNDINT